MSPLIAVAGRIGPAGRVSRIEISFAGRRYLDAVMRAGGEPVTLAPRSLTDEEATKLLHRFDGLLLMGGADVDPSLYGQDRHERTYGVDRRNDEFEVTLCRVAAALDLPTLAVCRGMQVANVAFGGTLHQHLDDVDTGEDVDILHGPTGFPSPPEGVEHPIEIEPGTLLAKALDGYGTPPAISYHHQAVDELGDGFVATARSDDGHVEAMEREHGWFVCLQWHPEDTAHEDARQQRIYDAFIEQAQLVARARTGSH
jgi:putative glutamine amidotransferase